MSLLIATKPNPFILREMGEESYPMEVHVTVAEDKLKEGATLLDVREHHELAACKLDGSLHIPMGEIPAQLPRLPKEGWLLILCHHGSRSAHVTHFLRNQGFENAVNVAGGIDAWAQVIDPQLNRY